MKKKLSMVLALMLVLSVALGTSAFAETSGTYKIGAYMPMTGSNAGNYLLLVRGQDLALEIVNENGGFNGQQVEIVRYDTTSSNEEAAKVSGRLVEVDKVDAALPSPMSNEILSSADSLEKAGIPTIVVGTSPTLLSANNWNYVWRAALNTDLALPAYLEVIRAMNYDSVAIVFSQEETCVKIKNAFIELCKGTEINIVAVESVETTDSDFTAPLANIVGSNPDIVFSLVTGTGQGTLRKQMRQLGFNGIVMEREIMADNTAEVAGPEATNFYVFPSLYITYTDLADCDIPYMNDFLTRYQAAYGELPGYDWVYRGYDEIMILWEASKIAGSNDKDAINEAIGKIQMEGLGGTLDFTRSHEGYEQFNTFVYADGKFSLFDNWFNDGGYDSFLATTGRDK